MSRLFVLVRPEFVTGFQLAGVESYGAEDVESAATMITGWLDEGKMGLLALDENFLLSLDSTTRRYLDASDRLYYLAIPGGGVLGPEMSRSARLTQMLKRTIGVHITFGSGNTEEGIS